MDADTWKAFDQNPITHSVAHHVVAIADLREKQGYARVSDVAKALNITRGSASLTLKSLKQRGLVGEDENRFLLLSEEGQVIADSVRNKKFIMKKLFCGVLGVTEDQADVDTCKIEHLISDITAQRLGKFLRYIDTNDPRVQKFFSGWKVFDEPCNNDPSGCPACNADCMDEIYGGHPCD